MVETIPRSEYTREKEENFEGYSSGWTRSWIGRRESLGFIPKFLQDLRSKDMAEYFQMFWMNQKSLHYVYWKQYTATLKDNFNFLLQINVNEMNKLK